MVAISAIRQATTEFLGPKRVAVTGVSRNPKGHGANVVDQRMRGLGYEVSAVNPNARSVEGDRAYPSLSSIPGGVQAVVIATTPETAQATMRECTELGIRQVWMHRGGGSGSVSPAAAELGRTHGIPVIDGGCPLMFDSTSDLARKCMRLVLSMSGSVPRQVS